jgi:phosphate/phosphite/phosphonate ABC transporter binding protein
MLRLIYKIAFISLILIFQGCKEKDSFNNEPIEIDFSEIVSSDSLKQTNNVNKEFNVAISAIISPRESLIYYEDLIAFISKKIESPFKIIQRKTYQEVNEMLRKQQVDMAFVCSGAYVIEKKISNVEILVVPVSNGKPFYQAYIIANMNSTIEKFEDFKDKTFAFTDPLSNTGKLFAIKRLNDLHTTPSSFFSKTIYTNAHDISMQLVSKNIIDGATIDGLIYNYIEKFRPERVANLKIIEKSEEFGIPPIVVPKNIDKNLKNKLKSILLNLHKDPQGKKILDKLLIDKFIEGQDANYNSIREMEKLNRE